jgi:hypothetical protein
VHVIHTQMSATCMHGPVCVLVFVCVFIYCMCMTACVHLDMHMHIICNEKMLITQDAHHSVVLLDVRLFVSYGWRTEIV